MTKLDGKALAAKVKEQVRQEAEKLPRRPGLAVVLVGDDPASRVYVVKGEREHLIPAVPEFVMSTDADAGLITVRLIEGM